MRTRARLAGLSAMALVPLVVLITSVFPATRAGVNSRGELPRSNSPQSSTSSRPKVFASRSASSMEPTG
jgi:hypothetical protein